ncbi:MAG: hypothetical protein PWQ12_889 [Clostridiales bacterium]|nr:hypothetical protein [Clostridiales bacterium]
MHRNLTELENKILNRIHFYVTHNKKVGIDVIAKDCFVSKATVIKLAKKLGFSGYSEMFYVSLASQRHKHALNFFETQSEEDEKAEAHISVFSDLLTQNRHSKIYLDSLGICDCAKEYYLQKLLIFGFDVASCYHFEAFKVEHPGLYLFFSYSGNRSEIIEKVSVASENGFKVIAFTAHKDSHLGKIADYVIELEGAHAEKEEYHPDFFTANLIILLEKTLSHYSRELYGE